MCMSFLVTGQHYTTVSNVHLDW